MHPTASGMAPTAYGRPTAHSLNVLNEGNGLPFLSLQVTSLSYLYSISLLVPDCD